MASKIVKVLRNPYIIFVFLAYKGFFRDMEDEKFLKLLYRGLFGKKLDLENPKTYNEKLQWLKLNDRNPFYTTLVDKYEVKKFVADKIGEEYVIPTFGVWDSFDDIDFDALPEQFVLKCTHDCGGLVMCKDKANFDIEAARNKINTCLSKNYYKSSREWPYKNVNPRIIAEKYMEDASTKELRDYKFFTFGGKTKILFVATDRQKVGEETKFDFFDTNYKHLPFTNGHPNAEKEPEKPMQFEKMCELAEKLSEGIPHVRVDFYSVNGEIYFGEMTLCHWSGLMPFKPEEWDYKLGEWINIKNDRSNV